MEGESKTEDTYFWQSDHVESHIKQLEDILRTFEEQRRTLSHPKGTKAIEIRKIIKWICENENFIEIGSSAISRGLGEDLEETERLCRRYQTICTLNEQHSGEKENLIVKKEEINKSIDQLRDAIIDTQRALAIAIDKEPLESKFKVGYGSTGYICHVFTDVHQNTIRGIKRGNQGDGAMQIPEDQMKIKDPTMFEAAKENNITGILYESRNI